MQYLFNNDLAPITDEIGFLKASICEVTNAYLEWMTPLKANVGISISKHILSVNLRQELLELLPLTSHGPKRFVFIQTKSKWCAYFDNSRC